MSRVKKKERNKRNKQPQHDNKKKTNPRTKRKKRTRPESAFFPLNNTTDITSPPPNDATEASMPPPPQMGPRTRTPRAFRSTTGGQRDFFWFPKFDKNKQTNKNLILIPLILLGGSPTCRIQSNLSLIELISTLSVHSCRCGDAFPLQLLLLTV